jgi:hypothetical protein
LVKIGSWLGKGVRQVLFAVLAALLCFIGPTYFVVLLDEIIPLMFALILGFVCFLVGIVFVFKLVEE